MQHNALLSRTSATQFRRMELRSQTPSSESRTVELVWSTGAAVRRIDRSTGQPFLEELSMSPGHVRLGRLNGGGANLLNSHNLFGIGSVLGVVERASVSGGRGVATVRFSKRADVEPIWRDVVDGVIRNVSVGYLVHRYERQAKKDGVDVLRATDWEPLEISLVGIPADAGARIRSRKTTTTSLRQRNARTLALLQRKLKMHGGHR